MYMWVFICCSVRQTLFQIFISTETPPPASPPDPRTTRREPFTRKAFGKEMFRTSKTHLHLPAERKPREKSVASPEKKKTENKKSACSWTFVFQHALNFWFTHRMLTEVVYVSNEVTYILNPYVRNIL